MDRVYNARKGLIVVEQATILRPLFKLKRLSNIRRKEASENS